MRQQRERRVGKEPAESLPAEKQPQPGPLPAEDDTVREIGQRAHEDVESGRKDTDEAGFDRQRTQAPGGSPTRRRSTT